MACQTIRSKQILWALLVCLLALSVNLYAQATRATIVGTIKDLSGAVLPGVSVTAKNVDTGIARNTVANETGDYTLPLLPIGNYEVSAEIAGFKTAVKSGILLQMDDRVRVDLNMEIGQISERVIVTGEAPLLQSENASIGNVIDHAKIVDLPLDGREFYSLAQLNPAVYAPAQGSTVGFRGGMNIAGVSEIANSYTLDGIENMDAGANQPAHRPSVDTIQEFKVLTGTYSAEYGRYSGGQIMVTTKSGTNEFHGTAYNFYRNSKMDARNFFATEVTPFTRNNFGGTIGGPIIKNRTFFFGGYEGLRAGENATALTTVPSLAMRNGDFSELLNASNPYTNRVTVINDPSTKKPFLNNIIPTNRIDRMASMLLGFDYALPNRSGVLNFLSTGDRLVTNDQWNLRIDHKITNNHSLSSGYQFMNLREHTPFGNALCSERFMPGGGCMDTTKTHTVFISDVYVFSPNVINELRLGGVRLIATRTNDSADLGIADKLAIPGLPGAQFPHNQSGPQVSVSGFATVGPGGSLPQGRTDNTYNIIDSVTINRGSHSIKLGGDWRYFQFNSFHSSGRQGSFSFNGFMTGYSVADFLLGFPRTASRNTGVPYTVTTDDQFDFFVQDDWKVSDRVTLNLGVRYEYNRAIYERKDEISSFDPRTNMLRLPHGGKVFVDALGKLVTQMGTADRRGLWDSDKNNFAPRIGIAYRPLADNTFVIRTGYGMFYNLTPNGNGMSGLYRGLPYRISTNMTASTTAPIFLSDPFTPAPGRAEARFSQGGVTENYLTGYVQQWSFSIQKEFTSSLMAEATYMGSQGTKIFQANSINQPTPAAGNVDARRPYQPWGNFSYTDNVGRSWFNSLQTKLERRMSKGVSGLVSYTFGKAMDTGAGMGSGGDGDSGTQDPRNFLQSTRGLSNYDIRHRFVSSFVIELPFGRGRYFMNSASRAVDMILGGWMMSGILTLQTGPPFSPVISFDNANTGTTNRPNLIGDWQAANPSPDQWFNKSAFCYSASCGLAPYTFGNAGRNFMTGPGRVNLDFSLMKNFVLKENHRLQFRGEFFNLTNHPNFYLPNRSVDLGIGGTISQADKPRTIQVALKYIF